jgi:hypothetical protein
LCVSGLAFLDGEDMVVVLMLDGYDTIQYHNLAQYYEIVSSPFSKDRPENGSLIDALVVANPN